MNAYSLTSDSNPRGCVGRPKSDFMPSGIRALTNQQLADRFLSMPRRSLTEAGDVTGAHNIMEFKGYPSILIKRGLPIHYIPIDNLKPEPVSGQSKDSESTEYSYSYPSEAYALQLIFEYTTIPVPRLRRVIDDPTRPKGSGSLIFMDSIPGRQLREVWPCMSEEEQIKVVFTMRSYIRQMRNITTYYRHPRSKIPGPLAAGTTAVKGYSPVFGRGVRREGPFHGYEEFHEFINERLAKSDLDIDIKLFDSATRAGAESLVLTHQDLLINMRNILVGDDGRIYLIDWTHAGFYPPSFELACAKILHDTVTRATTDVTNDTKSSRAKENQQKTTSKPDRKEFAFWDMMIPFMCGV